MEFLFSRRHCLFEKLRNYESQVCRLLVYADHGQKELRRRYGNQCGWSLPGGGRLHLDVEGSVKFGEIQRKKSSGLSTKGRRGPAAAFHHDL